MNLHIRIVIHTISIRAAYEGRDAAKGLVGNVGPKDAIRVCLRIASYPPDKTTKSLKVLGSFSKSKGGSRAGLPL
jgi:hypothetical protein